MPDLNRHMPAVTTIAVFLAVAANPSAGWARDAVMMTLAFWFGTKVRQ
jgi:hypothetical protein